MSDPAISVTGLTKIFRPSFRQKPLVAVRDLHLQVGAGQIYGLLGPNGSGKSTTLKIILGLVWPTRGRTEIFGCDSREVGSREAVGFLSENPSFYKFLTGSETLMFYGKLCGLRGRQLRRRVCEMIELVGLTSAAEQRLAGYSKGMLQRIGLAQALVHEPKLLVLDEPTSGVDPEGSRAIRDLILDLKKRGVTVLLSSHLLAQVQEICDRVGILAGGVLVRDGSLAELVEIENQTELIFANASAALLDRLENAARAGGATVLARRPSQTTLERLFLDVTTSR